jgi:hypothetical protein
MGYASWKPEPELDVPRSGSFSAPVPCQAAIGRIDAPELERVAGGDILTSRGCLASPGADPGRSASAGPRRP